MKLIPAIVLTTAAVAAAAAFQGNRTVSTSAQNRQTTYADMQRFAEKHLQLTRIDCGDLMVVTAGTPCYVTDEFPEQVRAALNNLPELEPVTGWRDDYGTLSARFRWKKGPWELGVIYARAPSSDFEDRPDIQSRAALVHIVIDDH